MGNGKLGLARRARESLADTPKAGGAEVANAVGTLRKELSDHQQQHQLDMQEIRDSIADMAATIKSLASSAKQS